jgi:hypothetical protein
MEALTKFAFRATADDELSFDKGSIVKVRRYKVFKQKNVVASNIVLCLLTLFHP